MIQFSDTPERTEHDDRRKAEHVLSHIKYQGLTEASLREKLELKSAQEEALETNAEMDHVEQKERRRLRDKQTEGSSFAANGLYDKPSAYITHLLKSLPEDEKLTRRQTLFMVKFAEACDEAWEDEQKPPHERRTHHILLLGVGGSGKTHLVQKLVFRAMEHIWPNTSPDSPSMPIVASSNAQAPDGISSVSP